MNKQDKIKKVMREFKDGKLKTPNGEVVTDKKQALAIAMSESEDYAEKADLIEDISIGSLSDAEDVIKGIGSEELLKKAVYADTAENRKFGSKKSTKEKINLKIGRTVNCSSDTNEPYIISKINSNGTVDLKGKKSGFKLTSVPINRLKPDDANDFQKGEDEMGISDAYRELFGDDLEKAHQDGDMHPNGKWVWVSSANGGKGDWRTLNGRAHKKHQETNGKQDTHGGSGTQGGQGTSSGSNGTPKAEKPGQQSAKMKVDVTTIDQAEYDKAYKTATSATETEKHLKSSLAKIEANIKEIKDALADVSNVTAGKLQKMLTNSISKKKAIEDALKAKNGGIASTTKNAHVQKLIDTYKKSNNSYTDISKMSIVITPKGNWNLRYDGKDVSTISGQRNIMDRKTLEAAGIKFEDSKKRPVGAGTNGPTPKTKADKNVDNDNKKKDIIIENFIQSNESELRKIQSDVVSIGYGSFNANTTINGKKIKMYVKAKKHDNYFANKPDTYSISIGKSVFETKKMYEERSIPMSKIEEIVRNYLSNYDD